MVHRIIMVRTSNVKQIAPVPLEERTARLTILIDPRKKAVFERLCADEDATPSQVVRRLIRTYIEEKQGTPWQPEEASPLSIQRKRGTKQQRSSKQP